MQTNIECWECDGEGNIESSSPVCFKSASECCGGCYESYPCDYCNATGKIEPIDEWMENDIMMLKSYTTMLEGFDEIIKEMNRIKNEFSEDGIATYNIMVTEKNDHDVVALYEQVKRIEDHTEILKIEIINQIERNWEK